MGDRRGGRRRGPRTKGPGAGVWEFWGGPGGGAGEPGEGVLGPGGREEG